ncbi:MAG: hypothetical protein J1F64_08925, partial [Oscillospiraceae bacterium]|nr:hypothetical protein [Oscillospiraceae bacterium]
ISAFKLGYEANESKADPATGKATMPGREEQTVSLVLKKQKYIPVPGKITMTGGQLVMTAPHNADITTSRNYEITVIDQNGVEITDAEIVWSIAPEDDKVSVENGVVSVAKGFDAGETHVKDFTVTAEVTKNGEGKSVSADLAISDYLFYEPGVNAPSYGNNSMAHLNYHGTDLSEESYISTPVSSNVTEQIILPDPIVFAPGTAQRLSFKTAVQTSAYGYTFKRTVAIVGPDSETSADKPIINFGYINLDLGDAETATWKTSLSSFETIWGSMPDINTWMDVTILFKTSEDNITNVTLMVNSNIYDLGSTTVTGVKSIDTRLEFMDIDRYALLKDIIISEVDFDTVLAPDISTPEQNHTIGKVLWSDTF